jgi:hypothetical protein
VREKCWGDTGNPKTVVVVVVVVGVVPVAVGRTTVIRVVVPRTAAQSKLFYSFFNFSSR